MSNSSDFPFPFIGAGEASYFEWAEVHVEFARAPTESERDAIAARVPPPLRDSIDFADCHLMVASDQFAHIAMAEAYGGDGDQDDEDNSVEDFEGRFFFASDAQVHAFNQDTDAWLTHSHDICPITVAFRAEDGESGGTELSDWHEWSVARVVELLPGFAAVLTSGDDDDDGRAHMVRGILQLALDSDDELAIPENFRDWLDPGRKEVAALVAGDSAELRRLLDRGAISAATVEKLGEEIDRDNDDQGRTLLAVADLLVAADALDDEVKLALLGSAARVKHDAAGDLTTRADEVLTAARPWAEDDTYTADLIGALGHSLATGGDFAAAIDIFDILVDLDGLAMTTYCNALWVIQRDNNELPLQPERARRFLAECVPHGPENPAIFYNAACVHMELGEHDRVLEALQAAISSGYDDIDGMKNEPLFGPIADTPEFVAIFPSNNKNP